ncbi:hypothetical protein CARUB_v10019288mg [Capsella rubella]|uniref:Uncharacterized protein n=1 Tax=Capsella rubella TaxID=81985 RepID=R0FSS8_9BRAS|nr:hypothetical protein CARUB_v10019288mg [Capsella rubella]
MSYNKFLPQGKSLRNELFWEGNPCNSISYNKIGWKERRRGGSSRTTNTQESFYEVDKLGEPFTGDKDPTVN